MDDVEERLRALESRYMSLEAFSIFQTQAIGVLLALIEYCAAELGLKTIARPKIRQLYAKMLREETEKFLATIADDSPDFASKIREILAKELDRHDGDTAV
jgi:hypothetical protein